LECAGFDSKSSKKLSGYTNTRLTPRPIGKENGQKRNNLRKEKEGNGNKVSLSRDPATIAQIEPWLRDKRGGSYQYALVSVLSDCTYTYASAT